MKVDIVIGANLGDEGKGTVVATCAKHSEGRDVLNVLTNGGSQRAHSIMTEDGSFTFQHLGSGTCHGADSFFSRFFIVNPVSFTEEFESLRDRGIAIPVIYRDISCRWSTPFDMLANAIIEALRRDSKHGSCGMGIWETTLRFMTGDAPHMGFDEFMEMDPQGRMVHLSAIKAYYERKRICGTIPAEWAGIWNDMRIVSRFLSDCEYFHKATVAVTGLADLLSVFPHDHVIFENGQGLMLTDTGKDVGGTTPSDTGSGYAAQLLTEISKPETVNLHYVTRPYMTRHGKGFLASEMTRQGISLSVQEDRTNHFNQFQDEFRYGILDIPELRKRVTKDAMRIQGANVILDVTHCDEMDRQAAFRKEFGGNVVAYDSPLIR